jgi:hypothetical protein
LVVVEADLPDLVAVAVAVAVAVPDLELKDVAPLDFVLMDFDPLDFVTDFCAEPVVTDLAATDLDGADLLIDVFPNADGDFAAVEPGAFPDAVLPVDLVPVLVGDWGGALCVAEESFGVVCPIIPDGTHHKTAATIAIPRTWSGSSVR